MKITFTRPDASCEIVIERGGLANAKERLGIGGRTLVVTGRGIPASHVQTLLGSLPDAILLTLPEGEENKTLAGVEKILAAAEAAGLTRSDNIVSLGGGLIGDMAGFAASIYLRGIDCYMIPTTLLSMADASVGGKTGVNFGGFKNQIGTFRQPKGVLIDPDLLATLDARQTASGYAEIIKMALTSDADLFYHLEKRDLPVERLLSRALAIKANIVEADECEGDFRRVLNFGHTLGHGIETAAGGKLFHGECVALGMLPMCSDPVRQRLLPLLKDYGLPTTYAGDPTAVLAAVTHDKKRRGDELSLVFVDEIGSCRIATRKIDDWSRELVSAPIFAPKGEN